ncbi:MFS transporter [Actinomycetes bacterium M1A6_2h]
MGEIVPLYAVYAIVFRENGLDTAQISTLFALWSVTAFALEIPSGAWADSYSRRRLLVLASLLLAGTFTLFTVGTSYWWFAAGFAAWGASTAIVSGTYQALVYDELTRQGRSADYAGLIGIAEAASMVTTVLAYLVAAPLLTVSYGLQVVGWCSVAVVLVQAAIAAGFPDPPLGADEDDDVRYLDMLRAGVGEAARNTAVRRAVLFVAMLMGLLAFDEYFPLAADDEGASLAESALLVAVPAATQAVGTALAGRTSGMSRRTTALMLGLAAAALAVTPVVGVIGGFSALAIAYGLMYNIVIVADARLQDSIEGTARATVTSVSGFLSEAFAITVFAYVATGSGFVAFMPLVGLLAVPTLGLAMAASRWLPVGPRE